MKRRFPAICMDETFKREIHSLKTGEAAAIASHLDTSTAFGIAPSHKNTLFGQACTYKYERPHSLILIREGEFYITYGVDAVMLVEHAGVSASRTDNWKVSLNRKRVQRVLNTLLNKAFEVAVYEESAVICTPRRRYLAQVVTQATPHYMVAADLDDNGQVDAKPIVAIESLNTGTLNVCIIYVQERMCCSLSNIPQSRFNSLVATAVRPLLVYRTKPTWLQGEQVTLLGGDPCSRLVDRALDHVCVKYALTLKEFQLTNTVSSGCAPLTNFTLAQLGMTDVSYNIPSLAECAMTSSASRCLVQQMRRWLTVPPSRELAFSIRETLVCLNHYTAPLPEFKATTAGRRAFLIQTNACTGRTLQQLRQNTRGVIALSPDFDTLYATVCNGLGLRVIDVKQLVHITDTIDAHILPESSTLVDKRGPHCNTQIWVHDSRLPSLSAYMEANRDLDTFLSSYMEEEIVRDSTEIALRGRVTEAGRVQFQGKRRGSTELYTTPVLKQLQCTLAAAALRVQDEECDQLIHCSTSLQKYLPHIRIVEVLAVYINTLIEHLKCANSKEWCMSTIGSLRIDAFHPYWMEKCIAQTNEIEFDIGTIGVLTAPNGGGKSTMLRAIGAIALLHQCGLLVPASNAVIPEYSHVHVRAGSLDCTQERRSSFANEMCDLRLMIESNGPTLILVDEPCRGTSTVDAVALLESILYNLHPETTAIFSTHFHELQLEETPRIRWVQLGARVVDGDCRPDFKYSHGRCTNSLALHIAMAVGLPLNVVRRARREEDAETLVLTHLYQQGIPFQNLGIDQVAPPTQTSTLYIIDTQDGIYVGESDRISKRLNTHRTTKGVIRSKYIAKCANKTESRRLEAALINELRFHNLQILSDTDGYHGV